MKVDGVLNIPPSALTYDTFTLISTFMPINTFTLNKVHETIITIYNEPDYSGLEYMLPCSSIISSGIPAYTELRNGTFY